MFHHKVLSNREVVIGSTDIVELKELSWSNIVNLRIGFSSVSSAFQRGFSGLGQFSHRLWLLDRSIAAALPFPPPLYSASLFCCPMRDCQSGRPPHLQQDHTLHTLHRGEPLQTGFFSWQGWQGQSLETCSTWCWSWKALEEYCEWFSPYIDHFTSALDSIAWGRCSRETASILSHYRVLWNRENIKHWSLRRRRTILSNLKTFLCRQIVRWSVLVVF